MPGQQARTDLGQTAGGLGCSCWQPGLRWLRVPLLSPHLEFCWSAATVTARRTAGAAGSSLAAPLLPFLLAMAGSTCRFFCSWMRRTQILQQSFYSLPFAAIHSLLLWHQYLKAPEHRQICMGQVIHHRRPPIMPLGSITSAKISGLDWAEQQHQLPAGTVGTVFSWTGHRAARAETKFPQKLLAEPSSWRSSGPRNFAR